MARETELYKDKIEVSLDGRQIFYLFFGGAVIVGMVFVLGVMVGRRVEARGHVERAHVEATVDPLAALDRLEGGSGLSFQGALRGGEPHATDVEKQIEQMAPKPPEPKKAEEPKPEPKAEPKPEPKPEPKVEKKLEAKADEPKPEKKKDDEPKADKPEKKSKFTLQLSSFKDKDEAQAFLDQIKSQGFAASMTKADVDGKQYYRVRMGTYSSVDAANDAKAEFEKSSKKSALVTKL
ncbi:MAG: SPOR domain-containing protein [Deltaproteobacteria bacterium]|nr:SPOR domain-containing protein [Deltaproteobacteria bacterium]